MSCSSSGGRDKWYRYRAVGERGQVVDVLLREHRDTDSAEACFTQALARTGQAVVAAVNVLGAQLRRTA